MIPSAISATAQPHSSPQPISFLTDVPRVDGIPSLNMEDNPALKKAWQYYGVATLGSMAATYMSRQALLHRSPKAIKARTMLSLLFSALAFVPFLKGDKLYQEGTNRYQPEKAWRKAGLQQMVIGGLAALPFTVAALLPSVIALKPSLLGKVPMVLFKNDAVAIAMDAIGTIGGIVAFNGWRDWQRGKP